jgi:predicted transcriptional regulator
MRVGVSDQYDVFLSTWAARCGVPPHVFKYQLDAMLESEIVECIRPFTDELTRRLDELARKRDPLTLALARLFEDLVDYLEQHDCDALGDVERERVGRDGLVARLKKAQEVLGLPPVAAAAGS